MSSEEKKNPELDELRKQLFYETSHVDFSLNAEQKRERDSLCEAYKCYLDAAKTEREAVKESVRLAKLCGYLPFDRSKKYKAGDKVYHINRAKAVIFAHIGTSPLSDGLHIVAAHIDSPRLDLKPNPLYEDSDIALLKTHYYGGVRKYQWATIPLALHGTVCKKDGGLVDICIGDEDLEPKFLISDLLPHLAREQSQKPLSKGIEGEELNIIIGSTPIGTKETADKIKLNILKILNDKYGIVEEDFLSAELSAVPAAKAFDIGFDRSLIGSYGHDDRVCAYTALIAQLHLENPAHTALTVLADKEEIGSVGATGLDSDYLKNFISNLANCFDLRYYDVLEKSCCLSADVNAALDPTFPGVSEKRNTCMLNRGVVMTKYTGSGGKSSSNDASAEFCGKVRRLFNENSVSWQTGELGKVDQGGGGTVACYVASLEMDVVDIGVPVLAMHAPCEIVAKNDVYMTAKAFESFFRSKD